MLLTIETKTDYERTLAQIENYLVKDAANFTEADLGELRRLSVLVERYEDRQYPMPVKTA